MVFCYTHRLVPSPIVIGFLRKVKGRKGGEVGETEWPGEEVGIELIQGDSSPARSTAEATR